MAERPDTMTRPEVLAAQKAAQDLRAQAEEADAAVEFWASLRNCPDHDPDTSCDREDCYRAWADYPDG